MIERVLNITIAVINLFAIMTIRIVINYLYLLIVIIAIINTVISRYYCSRYSIEHMTES